MTFPNIAPLDIGQDKAFRLPRPEIKWPTMVLGERAYEEGDLNYFPEEDSYRERFKRGIGGAMSRSFREAARVARDRIWLLDEQLLRNDESRDRLAELFYATAAADLRVITAAKEGAVERAKWLKGMAQDLPIRGSGVPSSIQIFLNFNKQRKDMPEVHDRFAIIDDVLWHCGATIGGLHNAINALTFGWSARDTHADTFFVRVCGILDVDDD